MSLFSKVCVRIWMHLRAFHARTPNHKLGSYRQKVLVKHYYAISYEKWEIALRLNPLATAESNN